MATSLRLLIDASVTEPLAGYITSLVPSALLSRKVLGQGAKDPAIADFANPERRMIVAVDSDFKKLDVKYGLIKINGPDQRETLERRWHPKPCSQTKRTVKAIEGRLE
jgi:hypothetical protein